MFVDRYGIHFGALIIHFYGLIIMIGVLAASYLAYLRAKEKGLEAERIWDMVTWALIGGILGARLWHLLTPTPEMIKQGLTTYYYFTHPLDAIAIWQGGLAIFGGVVGGALAIFIYARTTHQSFLVWADMIAPGLILAQGIGRWGNFVNQEVYGAPSSLPWAIYIDEAHRFPSFMQYSTYHPLFLYEFFCNVLVMAALLWLDKRLSKVLKPGDIFLFYFIGYGIVRYLLEYLRLDLDIPLIGGLNINQTMFGVGALLAAIVVFLRHRSSNDEDESSDENVIE
jgi:phosphatidylglycerol---prolipoprotein diacylglyceryl transferase